MSILARNTVCEYMFNENLKKKGANCFSKDFDTSSKLDAELAAEVVAEWYKKGQDYNYEEEPSSDTAGKLIIPHIIFIIMFLELIINYFTKYRNSCSVEWC